MMEKLYEKDKESILEYIMKEPEFNVFMIGDIENFGVNSDEIEVYTNDRYNYDFIIVRYLDNFMIYSQKVHYNAKIAAEFLSKVCLTGDISGKGEIVEKLIPYLQNKRVKKTYLCKLTNIHQKFEPVEFKGEIKGLQADDARRIVELYLAIDEFKMNYINKVEKQIENLKVYFNSGHAMGAFDNDTLAAVAQTSAENSMSAMIVGVAVLPEYRKKGLASALVSKLCDDCLKRGMKFLCLFYDNPKAGSIYRKIGFEEIGSFIMLK